jgi:hypothetical protein
MELNHHIIIITLITGTKLNIKQTSVKRPDKKGEDLEKTHTHTLMRGSKLVIKHERVLGMGEE